MSIYEQVASDEYWAVPPAASVQAPWGAQVLDTFLASNIMGEVSRQYRRITEQGPFVTNLTDGAPLALDVPGSLLKVVKDTRAFPVKDWQIHCVDPETFDEQAAAMVSAPLFTGEPVNARIEGPNGAGFIGRGVLYLTNAPSGRQLAGKVSHHLNQRVGQYATIYQPPVIVGSVTSARHKGELFESRITAASIVRPADWGRVRGPSRWSLTLGALGARPLIQGA